MNGAAATSVEWVPLADYITLLEHITRDQTQIFIETPYRNNALVAEMCRLLPAHLKLCIATDITGPTESIITRGVKQWQSKLPDLHKVPTIFLLYK